MAENYGNSSIEMLEGVEAVRKKPEIYLTYRTLKGAQHTVSEILGNAVDEAAAGFGEYISLVYHTDHSVTIRDYGRGVPMGWNERYQKYNWDIIYNKPYGGAKYTDDIPEDVFEKMDINRPETLNVFSYLFPIGTNGVGGYATQATSEFFSVRSYHNEVHGDESTPMVCTSMEFKGGYPVWDNAITEPTSEARGTEIHWKPDCEEVFVDSQTDDLDIRWIIELCENVAYLRGITIEVTDEKTGTTKRIEGTDQNGLLLRIMGKKALNDDIITKEVWKKGVTGSGKGIRRYLAKANISLAFSSDYVSPKCFHNTSPVNRGTVYNAVTSAFYSFFTQALKNEGIDVRIETSDYDKYITCVVATYSTTSSFEGQTKFGVQNEFLFEIVYSAVTDALKLEYGKGNKTLKDVLNTIKQDIETRIKIQEFAKQQRQAKKATKKADTSKLTECSSKNPDEVEIWIPEGDSAALCCEKARDGRFQAVLPTRGKILNVEKASVEKIFKCDIIRTIFAVLGIDMYFPGAELPNYDKIKSKKIIIVTDADEDGFQIRVLLFLVFWRLAPELLRRGYVYIAETPLFENILVSGGSYYCYSQTEQNEYYAKNKDNIRKSNRSKGLGENDPDMLWNTTMNPETRRLIQLKVDPDDKDCQQIVDCLFGNDRFKQRKNLLMSELGVELGQIFETVEAPEEVDITV